MSNKGVKRGSPGADVEKNPLGSVELSDEDAQKLQDIQKAVARVELATGGSCRVRAVSASDRLCLPTQSATHRPRCGPYTRSGGQS